MRERVETDDAPEPVDDSAIAVSDAEDESETEKTTLMVSTGPGITSGWRLLTRLWRNGRGLGSQLRSSLLEWSIHTLRTSDRGARVSA